jgi:hypothetical protein
MRIRLFHAFASNNSGSYAIVGSFQDASTAEEVARLIQEVSDEHHAWHEAHPWDNEGESPLDVFVRREGLRAVKPGREDAWPGYGEKPTAIAAGRQVLVYVPCTVTMPAVFGELFYAKGGRVDAEIDHAHEDIAVEVSYRPAKLAWNDPKGKELLDAFEARVTEALPAWTARSEHDKRPAIEPVWHRGFWGSRHLSVVFCDLAEGVLGLRRIAEDAGIELHLRVWECPHEVPDPFAILRARTIPWGRFRVIVWRAGPDPVATLRAVREVLGGDLAEARAALADLPRELVVDVDEEYARRAADVLSREGCDAEVVAPAARANS